MQPQDALGIKEFSVNLKALQQQTFTFYEHHQRQEGFVQMYPASTVDFNELHNLLKSATMKYHLRNNVTSIVYQQILDKINRDADMID